MLKKWLARLSWSFLILAAVLTWDAYTALRGRGRPLPEWRIYLQFAGAVLLFVLAMIGTRERHRHD